MKTAILIPCLDPQLALVTLVKSLREQIDPEDEIIIVNDGSAPEYLPLFHEAEACGCLILAHDVNRGKGAAIKTGLRHIYEESEPAQYTITADGDGQHLVSDILKMRRKCILEYRYSKMPPIIIGTRDLTNENVPARSRFGNNFSTAYFRLVTGKTIKDTQTGLRAIPVSLYAEALEIPGEHYDYEMNFLITEAKRSTISQIPISTVYEGSNSSSHFRTVVDSCRIYQTPLKYIIVSALCAVTDLSLFHVFHTGLTALLASASIAAATVGARVVSGILNFILNRKWSFSAGNADKEPIKGQAVRYTVLFLTIMLASALMVSVFSILPLPLIFVKIIVDSMLAFVSYVAQHNWVYAPAENYARLQSSTYDN